MPDEVKVREGFGGDRDWMAAVLAEAFYANPLSSWAVPDPAQREEVLSHLFRLAVDDAMANGYPFVTEDEASVALWFDRTQGPVAGKRPMDDEVLKVCGRWAPHFQIIDDTFADLEPRGGHFYLALLATHPDARGRGNGRALLDFQHRHLAVGGTPTYLEATDPRARELYLRAGFADMGRSRTMGDDGPEFWPMWRAPGWRP